jgi:hypothetical protein
LEQKFAEYSQKMKSAAEEPVGEPVSKVVEDQGTVNHSENSEDEFGEEQFYLEPIE